jgi:hypothetical protein
VGSCRLEVTPEGITPRVMDGEAFWQSADTALVKAWLETYRAQLGIRKRSRPLKSGLPGAVLDQEGSTQYEGSGSELSTGGNRSQGHFRATLYPGPWARKGDPPSAKPLTASEAREMDALLSQQALERIRQRGWSYAGPNKLLGKLGGAT